MEERTLDSKQTFLIDSIPLGKLRRGEVVQPNIKCLISVPINTKGETIGALVVINKREEKDFSLRKLL